MNNIEPELQFVVRHVLGQYLISNVIHSDEGTEGYSFIHADPEAVAALQPLIEEAAKAWAKEAQCIVVRNDGWLWTVKATRVDTEGDGPVVTLTWGWDGNTGVKTTGEDAFALAEQIFALFDGKAPPSPPERKGDPEFHKLASAFLNNSSSLLSYLGGSVGLLEMIAWEMSGRVEPPLKHTWVDYPEDHVKVCSLCEMYCSTNDEDDDEWNHRVCAGKPVDDERFQTIRRHDPRRTPELREAQRLDQLVEMMRRCDATILELEMFNVWLEQAKSKLSSKDAERFMRERARLAPPNLELS